MRHPPVTIAAFVALTLVNAADLVSIFFVGTPGNPAWEIVPGFLLALVGAAATVPAWRCNRAGLLLLFGSRAISTVIAVIYAVVGDQPDWVATGLAVGVAISVVGLALLVPAASSALPPRSPTPPTTPPTSGSGTLG